MANVFVATSLEIPNLCIVDIESSTDKGGRLVLQKDYGFKDPKVLFHTYFYRQSAWGEPNAFDVLEASWLQEGPPKSQAGTLTKLFRGETTSFSKYVFRLSPEDAIKRLVIELGFDGFEYFAATSTIENLVKDYLREKNNKKEAIEQKRRNHILKTKEAVKELFLTQNELWIRALKILEEIVRSSVSKISYSPPTSAPMKKHLLGLLGGYTPSLENEVETYNGNYRQKLWDYIWLRYESENKNLLDKLNSRLNMHCFNCDNKTQYRPLIEQPEATLWYRDVVHVEQFFYLRNLIGCSTECHSCGEHCGYDWPGVPSGFLLDNWTVTIGGGSVRDIFESQIKNS